MKTIISVAAAAATALLMSSNINAQDRFTVTAKADFVTDYIWRGINQNAGFSVQPTLGLSYKGVTLSAWGSQSLTNFSNGTPYGPQELDLALSYSIKGFTATVTDYWWNGLQNKYGDYRNSHFFEGLVSFNFSETCSIPLTISWATMFAGADRNAEGRLQGSTYISAAYDIACPYDITLSPSIGFTPWKGYYSTKANITDISLKASKTLKVTDTFSIPLFVQAIASPWLANSGQNGGNDKVYLIAGFTLGI